MNPFLLEIFKLLGTIKSNVIAMIRQYFSGNSTTGTYSQLTEYIGNISGDTTSTITSGMVDLSTAMNINGSPVITQLASSTFYIQPGTQVISLDMVGSAKPTVTIDSIALPVSYTPLRVDTSGNVSVWRGHCDIHGVPSALTTVTTTNADSTTIIYIQDQSTTVSGVA